MRLSDCNATRQQINGIFSSITPETRKAFLISDEIYLFYDLGERGAEEEMRFHSRINKFEII